LKLSKKTGLIIAIVVFFAAGIYLYMDYSKIVDEKAVVKEQLELTQQQLQGIQIDPLTAQQTEMGNQLSDVASRSGEVIFTLSQPISNIDAATALYDVAQTWGVQINSVTSSGLADEGLEGATFSVISLDAVIEGDMPNLVNFITHLNDSYTTGIVRSVTITAPVAGSGANVTTSVNASADLRMAVYTYKGNQ